MRTCKKDFDRIVGWGKAIELLYVRSVVTELQQICPLHEGKLSIILIIG